MVRFCRTSGRPAHPGIRIRPADFARTAALSLALLLASLVPASAEAPVKVLVFDLDLIDTSQEGADPDHLGRLERVTALLRDGLRAGLKDGGYEVTAVRDSAVAGDRPASVHSCNGCELDLGRRAGADVVVTGFIHKISTLILNMQIILRRTGDGGIVAIGNADIRGDNERSWRRGVEWLLRHRLLAAPPSER